MRKEAREIKELLDNKTGANKKGKKAVTGDKAHDLMQRKAEEAKEAKKRHMVLALRAIDRKAK